MDEKEFEKGESISKTEDESSSDESLSLDLDIKCETCNKTFSSFKGLVQHEKSGGHYKKLSQLKLEKKVNKNLEDEDLSSEFSDLMLYPKSYAECDTCQKTFSGPESFHQHLKSKVHHKKVAKAKLLEQFTENGKINVEKFKLFCKQKKTHQEAFQAVGASGYSPTLEETELDDNAIAESQQFECVDCEKVFTGVDPWFQHLVSKTHEKALKQKKLLNQVIAGVSSRSQAESEAVSSPLKDLDVIEVDGEVLICKLCHKSFSGPESASAHLKSKGHARNKDLKEWKIQYSAIKSATTQKTKAQDLRCENQTPSVPATTTEFEENNPLSSSENVDDLSAEKDLNNQREKDGSESSADLKSPDSASSDAADETENVAKAEKENVLLCYESYKNYKKIMNEIEENKEDKTQ